MTHQHNFSPAFYGDVHNCGPCDQPTNLADALASMENWYAMCCEVFDCGPYDVSIEDVLIKAIKTNTVGNLSSPVLVWIDPDGHFAVNVYEETT